MTEDMKRRLVEHTQSWIDVAFRTKPIDEEKITSAIHDLYTSVDLAKPKVIVVPSPLVMIFAYGAAVTISNTTDDRTAAHVSRDIVLRNVRALSGSRINLDLTYAAMLRATFSAVDASLHAASRSVDDGRLPNFGNGAAQACFDLAGQKGIRAAQQWYIGLQNGASSLSYDCYITAMRDVVGCSLVDHDKYKAWERCSREGSFRMVHRDFCFVSDFPERLSLDDQNRPHCEDGPSHRWRDGWSLYNWHGVRVPAHWIEDRANLSAATVFAKANAEIRRAGCEILGWDRILDGIAAKVIDDDGDPQIGTLYEGQIPGATRCGFLKVICGTGRQFVIPVPAGMRRALQAQAWIQNMPEREWLKPEVRG